MLTVGQKVTIKECHKYPELVGKKAEVIGIMPEEKVNAMKVLNPEAKIYPIGIQLLEGEHEGAKAHLYKLIGVRRFESSRRKWLYLRYCDNPIRPDGEHKGTFEVFPILSWSDDDVKNYIQAKGLPTSTLYRDWGVSGCSWCPFYGSSIYLNVLRHLPNHYDRIIALEEKLGQPSVLGQVWLRDLKRQAMEEKE